MRANLPKNRKILNEYNISEHHYISGNDTIYFFGEYEPRKGYHAGEVNSFISNLKKNVDKKGRHEWKHKIAAIQESARILSSSCRDLADYIWVPVPSSKISSDPQHDNRLVEILDLTRLPNPPYIREIITQKISTPACHLSGENRPNISGLRDNYTFHSNLLHSSNAHFVIFDDVLTSGCHFKACKDLIHRWNPNAVIVGVFLARVKHPPDFADETTISF
ncbi:hypothetical protein [Acetobacter cerevisiae]|uniref:hypothetical protein n=1 Tax=Acetobacter cerevisiae TaxID=178900 RepID=UPI000A7F2F4B|nr:hypothetical protein [Acetobacter cerevisiae]